MFGTIRKHQTWLWAIIITLTIISFVIFFSPTTQMGGGGGGRGYDRGTINGKKVTEQEFVNAWKDAHLHHFVMNGRWPGEDQQQNFDPERFSYQWLLLARKQQEMGIEPSEEAVARMGRQMIRAFERMGITSGQMFTDRILKPRGYSIDDFERFVRRFVGIQEMISTAGLSGTLMPPAEVKALYQRDHQEVDTSAVFFWASNYVAQVTATPENLSQFYSNRLAMYAIPERIQVDYVHFNLTNHIPQAESMITNLTEIVNTEYERRGTNAFPEAKSPEEAKASLRDQLLRQQALFIARSNALRFANQVFAIEPLKPENLKLTASSNNLPVQVSAPFDREEGPKNLPVGEDFAKAAFSLSDEEPLSQVLLGGDGAYVLALNKRLPREIPSFEQVREKVEADYKRNQSMMLAQQAARTIHQVLTNGLASGQSFSNLCATSNVKPTELPPFSISTRSLPMLEETLPLAQLKQAAFGTQPGKVSPVTSLRDGAMILYVESKLPLDPQKMESELPGYTAQLRRQRQQEAFDDWLRKESERGLRDTPLNRPQTQPGSTAAQKS